METNKILFKNRVDAGKKLGNRLQKLNLQNPIVLAIPNGGVIVGIEVAKILNCPLNLVFVQKIFYPLEDSLGFGAVDSMGNFFLSQFAEGLPQEIIQNQTNEALKKVRKKEKAFSRFLKIPDLVGKTAILIDDTLATGSSMTAAIKLIKKRKPKLIMVASPAVSPQAVQLLKNQINQLTYLYCHPKNSTVPISVVYKNKPEVKNQKVVNILKNLSLMLK